ncbi:CDP-alcohol phosphatidyltransferase family protein [Nocardioides aestuarii]|uniref:CDP-alcohol phosphatidyltransferase family protein n=1 Tax=Nocardioides aestuarii TaxID=252231 RepID=A0ABW4TP69_9ACTN
MTLRQALVASAVLLTTLLVLPGHGAASPLLAALVASGCWAVGARWVAAQLPDRGPGPADLVTIARGTLTCAAAGLVVAGPHPALLPLCVLALALDAVDGPVARRTGTSSAFGRRFDGEADAFLMLVLSAAVAVHGHAWVVVLGLLRYAFGAAGRALPWLRRPLPVRWWRKVATGVSGTVLVVALAEVLPGPATTALLLVALALLGESFGRDVLWLWRRRTPVAALSPVGRP